MSNPGMGPNNYPNWDQNYIPTVGEWNAWWSQKIDQSALDAAITAMKEAFIQSLSPDWVPFAPSLLFGGSNAGQLNSGQTGGYRVVGNHCNWWVTCNLIFAGSGSGQMTMTGLPVPAAAGALFKADVVSATGLNTNGGAVNAVLSGTVVSFYKNQDTGNLSNAIMNTDVENAASISLSGWYQIEDAQ